MWNDICAKLLNGLDSSCDAPERKYEQKAVVINKSDIEEFEIIKPSGSTCNYRVKFTLKEGTAGLPFQGPEAGSSFVGSVSKSRNELGHAQYIHNAQILVTGVSEAQKCVLDALDKGDFVVVYRVKGTDILEVYGIKKGLSTQDYEYNVQEGGGGTPIILSSLEDAPESDLPLIYESETQDGEIADWEELFENAPE